MVGWCLVADSAAFDVGVFAELLLKRPLWPHQLELARSGARYRVVCAGRQVGKSSTLSVIALFEAFTRAGILVMLVSAGEASSQRIMADCAALAGGSDLLRGSVLEETKSLLVLSNGSRILSVPASERQIRGWPVDLLIVDEAAFVANEVWSSAEPAIVARPGSRVILTSSPFGVDHFFRRLWQRGMDAPGAMYESWHWPSSISPLMDADLLEEIRSHENPIVFDREYLAVWTDSSGGLLSPDEISAAVLDYDLIPGVDVDLHGVSRTRGFLSGARSGWELPAVCGGLDWGSARDANAVVLLAALDDSGLNVADFTADHAGDYVFFVPWLEVHHKMLYGDFIGRLVRLATKYNVQVFASETNGVGAYPTEELGRQLMRASEDGRLARWHGAPSWVAPVWTDNRRKQAMFGRLKGMLQGGRLVLPRHPELLKQLGALQITETAAGATQISVPENRGHDDLAMALGQALSCIGTTSRAPAQPYRARAAGDVSVVELPTGTKVPVPVRMLDPENLAVFQTGVAGVEASIPW
jgi:hypothetical protein